jgi:ribosomal protein L37E
MNEQTYRCEKCGKEKSISQNEKIPECCGLPMAPKLEACSKPFDAETARPAAADEPCSDGTDGTH